MSAEARLTELIHPATYAQIATFQAMGLRERMEIQPGYAAVLRLAASRQAGDRPRGGPRGAQHI